MKKIWIKKKETPIMEFLVEKILIFIDFSNLD